MYRRIVLPLDGSALAARAIGPATVLAAASGAELVAVSCLTPRESAEEREGLVRDQLARHGLEEVALRLPTLTGPVAPALAEVLAEEPDSLAVMASVARSHTAAIVGSVAEELLRWAGRPVLLVGPHAQVDRFALSGSVVALVDGSPTSEAAVPLAGAWAVAFGLHPWVVTVLDEKARRQAAAAEASGGPFETAYVNRLARRLSQDTGVQVDFDVLHGNDPAAAITDEATRRDVAVLCAATHGRTGAQRVAVGSVAISIVHHAPCPVLLTRPPEVDR